MIGVQNGTAEYETFRHVLWKALCRAAEQALLPAATLNVFFVAAAGV